MKTAISIPDVTFAAAEETARRLGMSRSELYSRAVHRYIGERRGEGVTEALDRVYGEHHGHVDASLLEMQRRSLVDKGW